MKRLLLSIPHEIAPELHHCLVARYETLAAIAIQHDTDGEKTKATQVMREALAIERLADDLNTMGRREIFGW